MDPGPSLLQRLGHVIEAWAAARPTGPFEGEIGLSRVSAVNPTERLHDLPKNSFKVQDTTRPCKHIRVIVLTHMKDGAPCEDPEIRISNRSVLHVHVGHRSGPESNGQKKGTWGEGAGCSWRQ